MGVTHVYSKMWTVAYPNNRTLMGSDSFNRCRSSEVIFDFTSNCENRSLITVERVTSDCGVCCVK